MPTDEQAQTCLRVCQMLSTGFQPIHLFRYNHETQTVYILAGVTESIEIVVFADSEWEFRNE
ncbi:DUF6888 family protein [Chamaesiphon sp. VAR_48_metabat_403]|uniref:DUF6888 family protein n=1 Tax=Chamaesiphon sp. VAR_48_metabat_403 TaxID=2964700 RepID=UPI00286E5890|nr:hypothetical protein [Chamaesiphon sp. VAR_48_metabat_403]